MKALLEELAERLREIGAAGLARRLEEPAGIDFCSNDYLGLGRDPALLAALLARLAALPPGAAMGAPASRLLAGHTAAHAALEERLARFKGTEAALLFPSGYQANLGLLTALVSPADRALSDRQNHASLIDGLRLSGCARTIVPHLDAAAFARELGRPHPGGRTFLLTESLFSMDGDLAPLDLYAELAERHGACLIVDDAHATGLFGAARGSGLAERCGVERRALAVVSTLGKALGLAGAFVAGPRVVIDYLVSRCRPFVFTTAPPPLLLHAVEAALDILEAEPERRRRVLALAGRLRAGLLAAGVGGVAEAGEGPIVPLVLGDTERALAAAAELRRRGFDVRAVRPPTVPAGTARLRLSVHADHTEAQIDALVEALAATLAPVALPRIAPVSLAVVGTGTGVGKTVVSAVLLARFEGILPLAYWKPVATGAREGRDAATVGELCGPGVEVLPETYLFEEPLSPHLAARLEGVEILPERLFADLARHRGEGPRGLVVEGVGGLLVPFTDAGYLLADFLAAAELPCLLVARSGLGTINHTLLTLEALRARRLAVAGVVLDGPPNAENRRAIERLGAVPVVAEVAPLPALDRPAVALAARGFDPAGRLEPYLRA